MVENNTPKDRFLAIGIEPKTVDNILKNKALTEKFVKVLDFAKTTECPKEKGALFYAMASKPKPICLPFIETLTQ